jgi:hypothetical protein|eukprot:COSAG01_NODE_3871_length_5604_cov_15.632334_5_plen_118_part_00
MRRLWCVFQLSKDIMHSFQQNARTREQICAVVGSDVDLTVSILTAVHWPTYSQMDIKMQPELSQMQDVFRNFYLGKYSGRCLGFLNSLGKPTHCDCFLVDLTKLMSAAGVANAYAEF